MPQTTNIWKLMLREIRSDKLALVGLILFVGIVLTVYIWAAIIDPVAADVVNIRARRLPPGDGFILGTDSAGRDMLLQLILSARNSFNIAFIVTFGGAVIGIIFGLFSGFYGRFVDNVLMRILDFISMVPPIMLIIVFVAIIPNYSVVTFALMMILIFAWQSTARLIRVKALQQRELDYISTSKTLGTPNIVIIFREMLPNLVSIIVSNLTINMAANMGVETGLTFLGFGLPFGTPSLGRLVAYARTPTYMTDRLWMWLPAALLIIIMMLCINFVGQALNRVADAKKRKV